MSRLTHAPAADSRCSTVRLAAPQDATHSSALLHLLNDARAALARRVSGIQIDLSGVRVMNGRLLATIMLIVRESRAAGALLRLSGMTAQFRRWASTFGLLETLERQGLIEA